MATYRELHGKAVKTVTTNPSDDAAEGQIWFNSTDNTFKSILTAQAFSSIANLNTARGWMGSAGDKTAGIVFGGSLNPYPIFTALTEEYNGTGWTVEATCPSALGGIGSAGAGTQTAALQFGANGGSGYTNNSAHYNGSSWTAGGSMNTTGRDRSGGGTQTAGIGANAYIPGSQAEPNAETYNGSAWTAIAGTGSARYEGMGFGTQTAMVTCGGRNPPTSNLTATEEWDGSSWTAGGALPQGTHKGQGAGTQTAGTVAGGIGSPYYPNYNRLSNKVDYDGSSWSISPATMTTARAYFGGDSANSNPNFYTCGGTGPSGFPYQSSSEEFNVSSSVITSAAWSSGTALPGVRWNTSGAGIQTAGLIFGGATGPAGPAFLNTTFEYDGSSWTGGGATPINSINQFSAGIQTAAIGGGGLAKPSPGSNVATSYTYDGSSWTTITDTPTATKGAGGAGTSTACLIYGSDISDSSINQDSYYWNGSSWAEEGAMNTSFQNGASGGPTESTAFKAGSLFSGPETSTNFETYNGSAWTAGPSLITTVQQNRGFGSSADCLSIGGYNKITPVERYNGTAWATSPALGTGRKQFASSNFTAPGVANGWVGAGADGDSSVEHFTEETTAVNVKTLTQS